MLRTGISKPLVEFDLYTVVPDSEVDGAADSASAAGLGATLGAALPHDPFAAPGTLTVSAAGVALRVTVCNRPL